jgi:hypothetical protein
MTTKTIEIRGRGTAPRRIEIAADTRRLCMQGAKVGGLFEQVYYAFTGEYTADRVEVWDAEHAVQANRLMSDAAGQAAIDALRQASLKP